MRVLIQRVKEAKVEVEGEVVGAIEQGMLVFLGLHKEDIAENTRWMVDKLLNLRIFEDENGKMNLSIQDIKGEMLVVSQFTLYGSCTKGRRPEFTKTMQGSDAEKIYHQFVEEAKESIGSVETGIFGAKMEVSLINDGPVTFLVEK